MCQTICRRFWLALLAGLMLLAGPMPATAKTLSLGQVSGQQGDTVSVPVTLDDANHEVGGLAFTIGYDKNLLDFVGISPSAPPPLSNGTAFQVPAGDVVEVNGTRYEYYNPYQKQDPYSDAGYSLTANSTLFYQANGETPGRVMVAAASAVPITETSLFNVQFKITNGTGFNGVTDLWLNKSIIQNPDAGYPQPTKLPVLTGMPAEEATGGFYATPTYEPALENGQVTVNAPSYAISGSVRYENGGNATGVDVILRKQTASGWYALNDSTVTADDGTYSFSGKYSGSYKLVAYADRPGYYNVDQDISLSNQDKTADMVLPSATSYSNSITVGTPGNSHPIPGMKVEVRDANGRVVGVFPVVDGTFNTGDLPPLESGSYTFYAVYGSQTHEFDPSNATHWDLTLHSIQGTIKGLNPGDQVAVKAVSQNATLSKSVLSDSAADNGTVSYEVAYLLPASDYKVSAAGGGYPVMYYDQAEEFTNATAVDAISGNATSIDFNFGIQDTGSISGTVTKDSAPLSGQDVYAFDPGTLSMSMATTNATGGYELKLPAGNYEIFTIHNRKAYYYDGSDNATQNADQATVLSLDLKTSQTGVNLNIPVYTKTISGTVQTDNGDPVPGALMRAENESGRALAMTAQDGSYTLSDLYPGSYTVTMDPVGTDYPGQTTTAQAGDTGVDFVIKTLNTLSGSVTYQSNSVQGAMLYLVNQDTGTIQGGRTYYSDANGKFTIAGIPDGVYKLVAMHQDYEAYETSNLLVNQDLTQDVILSKGAWIQGTITEIGTSKDLSQVIVIVTGGAKAQYDMSDSGGQYKVNGLQDGTLYTVTAKKRGYEPQSFSVNASSDGITQDFALSKPVVTVNLNGTVTLDDQNSTAVDGAVVIIHIPSQKFKDSTTTDQDGKYSFTGLPQASNCTLAVVPPGDLQVQTSSFGLSSDMTKDIALPIANVISGSVTWSGTGFVDLVLFNADSNEVVAYQTLEAGQTITDFKFRGLTSGQGYKLLALKNGQSGEFYENAGSIGSASTITAPDSTVSIDLTN